MLASLGPVFLSGCCSWSRCCSWSGFRSCSGARSARGWCSWLGGAGFSVAGESVGSASGRGSWASGRGSWASGRGSWGSRSTFMAHLPDSRSGDAHIQATEVVQGPVAVECRWVSASDRRCAQSSSEVFAPTAVSRAAGRTVPNAIRRTVDGFRWSASYQRWTTAIWPAQLVAGDEQAGRRLPSPVSADAVRSLAAFRSRVFRSSRIRAQRNAGASQCSSGNEHSPPSPVIHRRSAAAT